MDSGYRNLKSTLNLIMIKIAIKFISIIIIIECMPLYNCITCNCITVREMYSNYDAGPKYLVRMNH